MNAFTVGFCGGFCAVLWLSACGTDSLHPVEDLPASDAEQGRAAPLGGPAPSTIPGAGDGVAVGCAAGTRASVVHTIELAGSEVCAWGSGDNLSRRDGFIRARREELRPLAVPPAAEICGVEFVFEAQAFRYDDYFLLLLDDVVLTSAFDFSAQLGKDDVQLYDWSKIRNIDFHHATDAEDRPYCLWAGGAASRCEFPETDTPGEISLAFSPETIQRALSASGAAEHSLRLVTTGDNDDSDCQHDPIRLSLTVQYAPEE